MLTEKLIEEVAEEFITFYLICVLSKTNNYQNIDSLSLEEIADSIDSLRHQQVRFLTESVNEIRRKGRIKVLMHFFFCIFAVCKKRNGIILKLRLLRESHRQKFDYIMKIFSTLYGVKFVKLDEFIYLSQ